METARPINGHNKTWLYLLLIVLSGCLFFFPFLGRVHLFDWDEINFAESAREMIVTGNYHLVQINFQPFWEKPPLFFWLQAGAMHLFGINEFAARFPNALFGVITLVTFFLIGKKLRSARFGWLWALAYLGSFLPHLYFKSGIIDPVFNYFIFMGIYLMYRDIAGEKWKRQFVYTSLSGIFIGLAVLTKGPVGLLVFGLVYLIYFIFKKFKGFPSVGKVISFIVFFLITCLLWFGPEIVKNGFWFLNKFIAYQIELFLEPVASHGEPWYYHFVVIFLGCFPISIIALPAFFSKSDNRGSRYILLMKILFWAVLILFSLTSTKIVHYTSLTYMPLAFLAALYLEKILLLRRSMHTYQLVLIVIVGAVFAALLAALPYVAAHPELIIPYIEDPYAIASLNIDAGWVGYESWIGCIYLLFIILSVVLFARKKTPSAISTLFYSTACCIFIYLVAVVPRIEKYSQGPTIEFYESLVGKDVYVWPVGFKSYAQYFYTQKPMAPAYGRDDLDFLLRGNIDRPAYFIVKVTNDTFEDECKGCQLIKQKGGFKFYKREAVK